MIDLSGQVVNIVLNPAASDVAWNNGVLTFVDTAGSTQNVACPRPVQRPDKTWATCFPKACDL